MLGILCGLEAEAAVARRVHGALIACATARPEQGRRLAREMVRQGAMHLVSFGLAGGLAPELKAGDLVMGTAVRTVSGSWACAPVPGFLNAHQGTVWGTDHIVATAREKAALYQASQALIADMESHAAAEVAAEAGIACSVLRVVADTTLMEVPPAALVPLRPNGRIDGVGIAGSIFRQPWQIPALVHLGRNTGAAMRVLADVVPILNSWASSGILPGSARR